MGQPLKLLFVAGARPNFMKVAPLIKQVTRHNASAPPGARKLDYRLVHTGQHYDAAMSDVFFRELGIPAPDANLEVGSGSHAVQTANVMLRCEPYLEQERPDWVVVVGDVNSTMAFTLVASKLGLRVAHVEAGLRSFDRGMPEEINRLVTDALADLLLTPSPDADDNLRREGVAPEKIRCVGNIMIDSLLTHLPAAARSDVLARHALIPRGYVFVTLHRPSNVDDRAALGRIFRELESVAARLPIIFPIHPRTRKRLEEFGLMPRSAAIKLVEPVGYLDSLALASNARVVLTDSGGLQEETTWFRTPCLTLRPNTERPVTLTEGSNELVTPDSLAAAFQSALAGPEQRGRIPALWDGATAARVVEALLSN